MPWYPHPSERYVAGFWDGQRWSIAQTDSHLMIEGCWMAFDDIVDVSYRSATMYSALAYGQGGGGDSPSYVAREFSINDVHGNRSTFYRRIDAPLPVEVPEHREAWEGLVDISRRFIEPRIARRILDSLRSNGEFSLRDGRWCFIDLSRGGFKGRALRKGTWQWSDYETIAVNPYFRNLGSADFNGEVRAWAKSPRDSGKTQMVTALGTSVPNAVVLGTLMPMCGAEFGGRVPVNPS